MHKQYSSLLLITFVFLSCHSNQTKLNKQLIKDTIVQTPKTFLSDNQPASYAGTKLYLDSLFSVKKDLPSFNEEHLTEDSNGNHINSVLIIGNLFTPNIKNAVIVYRSNDSTLNCRVFKSKENSWAKIFETNIPSTEAQKEDIVEIGDLNGDKIPDLKIIKDYSEAAIHYSEIADAWLFDGNSFTKIDSFDHIYNAQYDSSNNEVYSYLSTGCADMSKYFGEYKIINNKAVDLKDIDCNCCFEDNDSCEITIDNLKPVKVPPTEAYKFAPGFYKEMFKQELEQK